MKRRCGCGGGPPRDLARSSSGKQRLYRRYRGGCVRAHGSHRRQHLVRTPDSPRRPVALVAERPIDAPPNLVQVAFKYVLSEPLPGNCRPQLQPIDAPESGAESWPQFGTGSIEYSDGYLFRPCWRTRRLVWLHWRIERFSTAIGEWLERIGLKKGIRMAMQSLFSFGRGHRDSPEGNSG